MKKDLQISKYIRPAILLVGLIVVATIIGRLVSLEQIQDWSAIISERKDATPILYGLLYVLTYMLSTSASLPFGTALSLLGGAVFGFVTGGILIVAGASVGAMLAFIVSRRLISPKIRKRYPILSEKVVSELEKSERFYLLTVRLAPVFPFYLVNLLAGLSTMKTRDFLWVTALGIMPGVFALSFTGSRLQQAIESGQLIQPQLLAAFAALGLISFAGGLYNRRRQA